MRFIFRILLESLVGMIRWMVRSYEKSKENKGTSSFLNDKHMEDIHESKKRNNELGSPND